MDREVIIFPDKRDEEEMIIPSSPKKGKGVMSRKRENFPFFRTTPLFTYSGRGEMRKRFYCPGEHLHLTPLPRSLWRRRREIGEGGKREKLMAFATAFMFIV